MCVVCVLFLDKRSSLLLNAVQYQCHTAEYDFDTWNQIQIRCSNLV